MKPLTQMSRSSSTLSSATSRRFREKSLRLSKRLQPVFAVCLDLLRRLVLISFTDLFHGKEEVSSSSPLGHRKSIIFKFAETVTEIIKSAASERWLIKKAFEGPGQFLPNVVRTLAPSAPLISKNRKKDRWRRPLSKKVEYYRHCIGVRRKHGNPAKLEWHQGSEPDQSWPSIKADWLVQLSIR